MGLIFVFILFAFFISTALLLLIPIISGAPWVPTRNEIIQKMVLLADIKPGEKTVDLGSGDGRIVIAFAKAGAEAHGFEINPLLVWFSQYKIKKAGLKNKAFIHLKDFWGKDFSSFKIVTLFGISYIMPRLEKKLQKELLSGSKIVSYAFEFPKWQPSTKENGIYLYKK